MVRNDGNAINSGETGRKDTLPTEAVKKWLGVVHEDSENLAVHIRGDILSGIWP